jgi:hypothetical protein
MLPREDTSWICSSPQKPKCKPAVLETSPSSHRRMARLQTDHVTSVHTFLGRHMFARNRFLQLSTTRVFRHKARYRSRWYKCIVSDRALFSSTCHDCEFRRLSILSTRNFLRRQEQRAGFPQGRHHAGGHYPRRLVCRGVSGRKHASARCCYDCDSYMHARLVDRYHCEFVMSSCRMRVPSCVQQVLCYPFGSLPRLQRPPRCPDVDTRTHRVNVLRSGVSRTDFPTCTPNSPLGTTQACF